MERRYFVHVPPNYKEEKTRSFPVVVMLHGGGGTAAAAMRTTGWTRKADEEGFMAVFPEGTSPNPSRPGRFIGNPQTWNDGSRRPTVGAAERDIEDVKFVAAMLDDLKAHYKVDPRKIYVTGFSNGGSMTFRLARELSLVISAIAPVTGHDWLQKTRPSRPVPVLYITGTADPLNPIEGGEVRLGRKSHGHKPATGAVMETWRELHGCSDGPRVIYDKEGARGVAFSRPGDSDPAVVLYTLDGHGHYWPGGKALLPKRIAGKNTAKIDATEVIWAFFEARSLPGNEQAGTR